MDPLLTGDRHQARQFCLAKQFCFLDADCLVVEESHGSSQCLDGKYSVKSVLTSTIGSCSKIQPGVSRI